MMDYNDDKVKAILRSEEVPEKLKPENIKQMLDDTNAVKKRKQIKRSRIIRTVSTAAAFVLVFTTGIYFAKPILEENNNITGIKNPTEASDTQYSAGAEIDSTKAEPITIGSLSQAECYEDVYDVFIEPNAISTLDKIKNYFNVGSDYSDYEESYDYMSDNITNGAVSETPEMDKAEDDLESGAAEDAVGGMGDGTGGDASDYSDTYNQENGVLEADIVKTNGKQIFFSMGEEILCAEVENGTFKSSDRIIPLSGFDKFGGVYIEDMYICGDKLLAIGTGYYRPTTDYSYELFDYYSNEEVSFVSVYDTETLSPVSNYYQDGYYSDVRMTDDGYLYLVSNKNLFIDYNTIDENDYKDYIPSYSFDGENALCSADDILIPEDGSEYEDYISYTIISSFNLNNDTPELVDMQTVSGDYCNVYCTKENLYTVSGYEKTEITRFEIENGTITPAASAKVDGYVNDQFSLSEYNGYLRVVTTIDEWAATDTYDEEYEVFVDGLGYNNCLYVLDMDLNVVGSVSDFGIDETIKSVNYDGDMAYVVTFMQTDPLFAIDVSNPANPVILDEYKITGYSSYMQKWNDGYLLGFGAEADSNGWETGVKLTMFDNSDPENLQALCSVLVVSDDEKTYDVYSEAIFDRKSLYIDPERNIIGFPVDQYNYVYTESDPFTVCSYEFYSFENGEFMPLGSMYKNYYDDNTITESFRRAVYIDGYLYALSGDMFISANAETFEQTDICEFEQRYCDETICE